MNGFRSPSALHLPQIAGAIWLCLALTGCGAARKVASAFDEPLNVTAPIQTSWGNFTVSADDASAAVANAAAVQQAAATCAAFGLQNRTVNSSASVSNGRHYFKLDFQCQ
jgi:hypothetical protein